LLNTDDYRNEDEDPEEYPFPLTLKSKKTVSGDSTPTTMVNGNGTTA